MLPTSSRLLTRLSHDAQSVRTLKFTLKYEPNQKEHSRFGFVISKRVSPLAVTRNKTKRIARSCIEHYRSHITHGYDLLFILHLPLEKTDEICDDIAYQLKKQHLWHE